MTAAIPAVEVSPDVRWPDPMPPALLRLLAAESEEEPDLPDQPRDVRVRGCPAGSPVQGEFTVNALPGALLGNRGRETQTTATRNDDAAKAASTFLRPAPV